MKKRYSEEQIVKAIQRHESGVKGEDINRELGLSTGTFYNWRSKYAGLEVNEAKRLRELETENNSCTSLARCPTNGVHFTVHQQRISTTYLVDMALERVWLMLVLAGVTQWSRDSSAV